MTSAHGITKEVLADWWTPVPECGCFLWLGAPTNNGYGAIKRKGKNYAAHRISWEVHNDQTIPAGLCVMHKCDTPMCVNPAHLRVGTVKENMADRDAKGRGRTGTRSGPPRIGVRRPPSLTPEQAAQVRQSRERTRDLATKFGVSVGLICNIRTNKPGYYHIQESQQ